MNEYDLWEISEGLFFVMLEEEIVVGVFLNVQLTNPCIEHLLQFINIGALGGTDEEVWIYIWASSLKMPEGGCN